MSGRLSRILQALHRKHGDVVRTGPNELVFMSADAFRVIYGRPNSGHPPFLKAAWYRDRRSAHSNIITARDPEEHRELRKQYSPAFRPNALADSELAVRKNVDMFTKKLGELSRLGRGEVDVTLAYIWLTTDVIGDFVLGQGFDCVAQWNRGFWDDVVLDSVKHAAIFNLVAQSRLLRPFLPVIMPPRIEEMNRRFDDVVKQKLQRCAENDGPGVKNSLARTLRRQQQQQQQQTRCRDQNYVREQAKAFIGAGSETVATSLAAATYFLLRNPTKLHVLQHEIRSRFPSRRDITGHSTGGLRFLRGVVEECLRLFPPGTLPLPRICPGAFIGGRYVPAGTVVSVSPFVTARDGANFRTPDEFCPERWLNGDGASADNTGASKPFSTGPRGCLGVNLAYLEMRLVLANLVYLFDWELVSDVDWMRDAREGIVWQKPALVVRFLPREVQDAPWAVGS
ncbi:Cytochrome P450 [Metarhizium album ARSEF 1941]|uniref:Cytochrome P450 n=1 Tax=Metarhizium album (strain ARSEF 1941) TaxID=1081103 RepID=A0A0B2WPU1_METAS|nr:Cytochrome P450 [Metarhizium album ARSEF 1941]KHN95649.1 Cytochrome P450 [Metarhizium album ARSEF 1941]